jgi:acyl transferase domain-containing protein
MNPVDDCITLGNVHGINVANSDAGRSDESGPRADGLARDDQLLLLDAERATELRRRITCLMESVSGSAFAGLGDLAATLRRGLADRPVRAAVLAASPDQAAHRLGQLADLLDGGVAAAIDVTGGVFAGGAGGRPAIGYLFPGQGSGRGTDGGALAGRFKAVRDLYQTVTIPAGDNPAATDVAQPRIVASSAAGLRVLSLLGIEASVAAGHSLGELTALHWAGAMTESMLLDLARARGQIMADVSDGGGAMAGIAAGPDEVQLLLRGEPVVIAGYNSPAQTVVAGPAKAVARVRQAAAVAGLKATRIPVSDAFHSPAMAPAAADLSSYLEGLPFGPLTRRVMSTVTGHVLPSDADLRQHLVRQLCEPVRFSQALERMAAEVSLLIEVGPGRVLSGLTARICPGIPVVPLATDSASLSGVLCAVAAAYVLGAPVRHDLLDGWPRPYQGDI